MSRENGTARSMFVIALVCAIGAHAAGPEDLPFHLSSSIAPNVLRALENDKNTERYRLVSHLNPFYLHGGFNGDGRIDTALLVRHKEPGKVGIAIVHAGAKSAILVGGGRNFGNGGDDFRWMNAWHLFPRGSVSRGADETPPPTLKGDAIMVVKTESASALIYWNGKRYARYQQGD